MYHNFKRIVTLLIVICFSSNNLNAQLTEVISDIYQLTGIYKNDNLLYYGTHFGDVWVKDLDSTNPPENKLQTNDWLTRILISNNTMYLSNDENISTIDISTDSLVITSTISGFSATVGLLIKDNYLYVADYDLNSVTKIDLSNPNTGRTILTEQVNGPHDIAIIGETLFIAEIAGNRISTLDLSQAEPELEILIEDINSPTGMIFPTENIILVSSYNGNAVHQIDISEPIPIIEDLVTDVLGPTAMFLDNQDLYFNTYAEGKIYVYTIPDYIPPVCQTQNISIELDEFGLASISVEDVNNGSYDNDEIESINIDIDTFDSSYLGDNIVELTVIDLAGNISTCTATVTVLEAPVAVVDNINIAVEIMPNPAKNNIQINLNSNQNIEFISIIDNIGKILIHLKVENAISINESIDISHFSKGIYFVKIKSENGELIKKLMKL